MPRWPGPPRRRSPAGARSRCARSRTSPRRRNSVSDAAALSVEQVFRLESGRAVATLVRLFGDIDVAEEAVQDAFVVAAQSWPEEGVPPNPGGWIVTTARNRAIDRFRRESSRYDRYVQAALLEPHEEEIEVDPMSDDRLRLIFTCC